MTNFLTLISQCNEIKTKPITYLNTLEIIFLKACESHFYILRVGPGLSLLHFKGVSGPTFVLSGGSQVMESSTHFCTMIYVTAAKNGFIKFCIVIQASLEEQICEFCAYKETILDKLTFFYIYSNSYFLLYMVLSCLNKEQILKSDK